MRKKSEYRVLLFCVVTVLFWFSMYTYTPILTAYAESLGASHQLAGYIVGSYGVVQMLLRIPLGILATKLRKRKLFIEIGILFALLSNLGLLFSKELILILIFNAVSGAAASTWVEFTVLFSSYYRKEEATKAMGIISFCSSVGQMAAMYFGAMAADRHGYRASFALGTMASLAALALSAFLLEKYEEGKIAVSMKAIREVIFDRNLVRVSVLAILSQFLIFATIYGFTPVYAVSQFGVTKYDLGILSLLFSLPGAVASLWGGKYLAVRFGEKKIVVFGFLLMGIFTLLIPTAYSFHVFLGLQVLIGFGRGLAFTMLLGLSIKNIPFLKRSAAMGFYQSVYGLGMFVGPVVMGILGDVFGLAAGFAFFGAVGILTAVCAWSFLSGRES